MFAGKRKSFKTWGILVFLVLALVLSGCGKNAGPEPSNSNESTNNTNSTGQDSADGSKLDTSKEITLKMVLLGAKPADFDEVYGEVNKRLKEKVNATLDVSFIDWGDVEQKYPLLFAANEDVDLVFSANWNKYTQIATKNGYMEITENLLKEYAPITWEQQPEAAWEQARVNGKVYMVPQNGFEYSQKLIAIRGDLREKHGIPEVKTLDDYQNYLKVIAEKEKSIIPSLGPGEGSWLEFVQPNEFADAMYPLPIGYKMNDATGKVFSYMDTPEYTEYIEKMYTAAQAGAWQRDAIVSKMDKQQAFKDGKLAAIDWNLGTLLGAKASIKSSNPEWKIEIIDISNGKKRYSVPFTANGMSISASSKNPERALMVLDLLRYDKEIHDLTFYGIEGKHYEAIGDDQFKSLPASEGFPPAGVCPWGWVSDNERQNEETAEEFFQTIEEFKKVTVNHPLETFVFDDSNVKNEIAAINNAMDTFGKPLKYGMAEPGDTERGVAVFQEKLKSAGIDKVIQEMQKQVDEFLK
ncbi:ABC transporter substrate-binding protein [Paenibacillus sp. LHD-117]|uniref:ABC transporter substrate-binding protein n=1 Tax=Paenibacillus sp. LHD-117 TaxID=3071412 RepID=UPI0027E0318F|nr:ABC transporter substrate-binding protein [Paenibacillus sp. LHD-117]MDQ6422982.1 ABC transporter substrate-binding protein [Paenibacillus sp. LHD-117]